MALNPRALLSLLPVVTFLTFRQLGFSVEVTVAGGFVATAIVFALTRRERLLGTLSLLGFMVVAFSAMFGLVWRSEKAYLAAGPVSDFVMMSVLMGSVFVGRPLVGSLACELFPGISRGLPPNARAFFGLSVLWAAFNLLQGGTRWYLLINMSAGEYTVWTKLLNYPISAVLFLVTAWVIIRAAREFNPNVESTQSFILRRVREG